jgi:hypothetical protein
LLNDRQRDELVNQLKVLPGHKAKLAGFFSVIEELYPRKVVVEQLNSFTPSGTKYGKMKNNVASTSKSLLR